jgi:hypothetical protein
MAETKPITTRDKDAPVVDDRPLRTVEQTLNEPLPPPTPTQAEADAIKLGEYTGDEGEPPPPEGETVAARQKREEDARKKREAKAAADQQASYQTRNA